MIPLLYEFIPYSAAATAPDKAPGKKPAKRGNADGAEKKKNQAKKAKTTAEKVCPQLL